MDSIPTTLPSFVSTEHLGIFPSISAFFFSLIFPISFLFFKHQDGLLPLGAE